MASLRSVSSTRNAAVESSRTKPIVGGALDYANPPAGSLHPIIRTSIAADTLDQRLNSIKQQIDHVLLGGMLKDDGSSSPRKQESPRPMTTNDTLLSPLSLRSTVLPAIDATPEAIARSQAYLCADDEIEKWIQNYEAEKHRFTSYALFTEYKLDQLANFTANTGRPNVLETAACCAALFKIPGILGNYRSLLQKIVVGLGACESSFTDDIGFHASTPRINERSSVDIVRSFYHRKPFFVQLRELEHDHAISVHLGGARRSTALLDQDKRRVIELCSADLLEAGLLRFSDEVRQQIGMKLVASVANGGAHLGKAHMSDVCRRLLKLAEALDMHSRALVVSSLLDDLDEENRALSAFQGLGYGLRPVYAIMIDLDSSRPDGEARVLQMILNRDEKDRFAIRDTVDRVHECIPCLVHLYAMSCDAHRTGFLAAMLGNKYEYGFICDLAKVIRTEQLEQLADFVNGATHAKLEAQWTGLDRALTPDHLHALLTSPDSFPKPYTPSEQRRLFDDVCSLLRNWSSVAIDFCEHLLEKCRSLHPAQRKILLATLLHDDFGTSKAALADLLLRLSPTEKQQLQTVLHDTTFVMAHFNEQVAHMSTDTRSKVLYAVMESMRASVPDDDARYTDPVDRVMSVCRELFGITLHTDPRGCAAPTSNHDPMTTETAAHTLDVLHQLDDATRNTIIQSLVHTMDVPTTAATTSNGSSPYLSEERRTTMIAAIDRVLTVNGEGLIEEAKVSPTAVPSRQLSVEEQIVSGMTEQDTSSLLEHAMMTGKTPKGFAKVIHKVVSTLEATGRRHTVDRVLTKIMEKAQELGDEDMTDEERAAFSTASTQDKLSSIHQVAQRHARGMNDPNSTRSDDEDDDDLSDDERNKDAVVKAGMANVACQTDVNFAVESNEVSNSALQTRKQPVTLTSLTKRAKGKKVIKVDSANVPHALASLVTSWKINVDQLAMCCKKPLGTILRTIADTYAEKIVRMKKAGSLHSASGVVATKGADSLAQIAYQSLLHSYGLPSIADMHLIGLGCALDMYRNQHRRVDLFCQFLYNEVPGSWLGMFLQCIEVILDESILDNAGDQGYVVPGINGQTNHARVGSIIPPTTLPSSSSASALKKARPTRLNIPDKDEWLMPLDRALEVVQYCFRSMRRVHVAAFCDKITQGGCTATSSSSPDAVDNTIVNVDVLLAWVVGEWNEEQLRRDKHLRDAFRAGDNNGDGQLSYEEFRRIVLSIDKSRDDSDVLQLFSDTLRRTGSDTIAPDDFLVVAKEYGLAEMAWDADGDLNSISNGLHEMNSMWPTVRPFFVGTLEALGRDLPPTHFLRTCQAAGCGCLKCLVDGYAGFQAMRGNATEEAAVAIWKRFWHLMAQVVECSTHYIECMMML
ncbi:hypothetical protein DYB32_001842 [Aphanomyces invadans]|uniref:EF-hand domain-containing protein n=1 Tax=Aphanomyces invadans TaxID=157072 RepID=A0A418B9G7_9STRA|nr:hypothetical protein DYB32_001842 [Aphanomyces invadans]